MTVNRIICLLINNKSSHNYLVYSIETESYPLSYVVETYDEEVNESKQGEENINAAATTQSDEQQAKGECQDAKNAQHVKLPDSDTMTSLSPSQVNSPLSPTAPMAAQIFNQSDAQQKNGSSLKQQPRALSQGKFYLEYRLLSYKVLFTILV